MKRCRMCAIARQVVADMLMRMRREFGTDETPIAPEIDQLILIDRAVVRVAPCCRVQQSHSMLTSRRAAASCCIDALRT